MSKKLQVLPPIINLKIVETKLLDWSLIEDFQPKGFKRGSTEGLKNSILESSLIDRFKVFQVPKDRNYYMFDGHSRRNLMLSMKEHKEAEFPDKLECDVLNFIDKKEAALALLKYQSGKLKITESGIIEMAEILNINKHDFLNVADAFFLDVIPEFAQIEVVDSETSEEEKQQVEKYTRKIEVPTYSTSNEKPNVRDIVDTAKTDQLIKKIIDSKNISEEEKNFLILAAQRHTVFNYAKIADYFAHSNKEMQSLMQDSVLVIIDFNKALENGFIKISNDIADLFPEEKS